MRAVRERDRLHLIGRRHLKIERPAAFARQCRQRNDIRVRDMPTILAQVRGYPVGAGEHGDLRRAGRIRIAFAPRVTNRGDVIDIYAQAQRAHTPSLRLPGSSSGMAARSGGS